MNGEPDNITPLPKRCIKCRALVYDGTRICDRCFEKELDGVGDGHAAD